MSIVSHDHFKDQVAIVTGAGQGIGFEIVKALCEHGASVVLNDLDKDLAQRAADKIDRQGFNCVAMAGDVSEPGFIAEMVNTTVERFGKLTMIVANAGITKFGSFLEYPAESLQQVLQLNLVGSFLFAQAAARQMVKQESGGSIVFMSSVTGHQAHKDLVVYGMTKAALEMLAKGLVVELSEHKISINAIAPGATLTERTLEDPNYVATWSRLTPTGRPGEVQDIANAALFLLSPASRQITGQTIVVDGGWSCVSPSPY